MKTKFALAFYYLSISLLVACSLVIVIKLIFWPPCTQMGNTCVIDPWSVAGLAATILGVAGTILAVFGAVAVAAWWTSLNDRVNDQVNKQVNKQVPSQVLSLVTKLVPTQVTNLYNTQKAEVDQLLADQRKELNKLQKQTQGIDGRLQEEYLEITELKQLSQDVEDITIDGLMAIGAPSLEAWAKKAIQKKRIPHLPLRMATGYLDALQYSLPAAEKELKKQKEQVNERIQAYDQILNEVQGNNLTSELTAEKRNKVMQWGLSIGTIIVKEPKIIEYWNQASYWLEQAKQEEDPQTYEQGKKRLEAYQGYLKNFQLDYEQLRARIQQTLMSLPPSLLNPYVGLYPFIDDVSE